MTDDGQWMRDVFDTTRGKEEPGWFPDAQAMIAGGDRRRRRRTVGAGSGSLAVVAAAATIAVSLAPAGGGRSTTAPPTTPLSSPATPPARSAKTTLDQVVFMPLQFKDMSRANGRPSSLAVPEAAVSDMTALLAALDPASSHIVPESSSAPYTTRPTNKAVPFGDPDGDNLAGLQVNSSWTPDGRPAGQGGQVAGSGTIVHSGQVVETAPASGSQLPDSPNGNLLTRFLDGDDPKFQPAMPGCGAGDDLGESWSTLSPVSPDGPDKVAWSACEQQQLGDGSILASSTKSFGKFTAVFASRQFPGGAGSVEELWLNYSIKDLGNGGGIAPNPDTVLSPSPLTAQKLTAALSGKGIAPGLKAATPVTVPPTMLQAADFGAGWKVSSTGTTSRPSTLVTDACATDQTDLVGPTVPDYVFSGPTPSGLNVRADVFRLTVKSGTGAQKLANLRAQAETGCGGGTTVTSLPSGIGDGGFVENIPGLPSKPWDVFVRFGDVVIQVYVNSPETAPAFTQADKQWLTGLGSKVAARYAAKG